MENVFGGEIPHWLDDLSRAPDAEVLVQLWVKDHDAKLAAASRQITQICHELPASLTDAGHCVPRRFTAGRHRASRPSGSDRFDRDRRQNLDTVGAALWLEARPKPSSITRPAPCWSSEKLQSSLNWRRSRHRPSPAKHHDNNGPGIAR